MTSSMTSSPTFCTSPSEPFRVTTSHFSGVVTIKCVLSTCAHGGGGGGGGAAAAAAAGGGGGGGDDDTSMIILAQCVLSSEKALTSRFVSCISPVYSATFRPRGARLPPNLRVNSAASACEEGFAI